jgi:hypothetical protein
MATCRGEWGTLSMDCVVHHVQIIGVVDYEVIYGKKVIGTSPDVATASAIYNAKIDELLDV